MPILKETKNNSYFSFIIIICSVPRSIYYKKELVPHTVLYMQIYSFWNLFLPASCIFKNFEHQDLNEHIKHGLACTYGVNILYKLQIERSGLILRYLNFWSKTRFLKKNYSLHFGARYKSIQICSIDQLISLK